ncbi:MAG: hypothetical protein PHX34_05085 [Candidatus Shapirobacteria bacterium]|nr:hypothetical protein [Candidatus Shapirobacteria bacterium]
MNETSESLKPNAQKITEVKAICEGSITFKNRSEIAQYVEKPLVSACEHFWDLGIQTLMSSANNGNVGNNASIDLDYSSLSEENRKIAEELSGKKGIMHGSEPIPIVQINISPITTETTIAEIKKKADEIANHFKKQKAIWIPAVTLEYLRKIYRDDNLKIEDFTENYFYDETTALFYESKEHYDKLHETIE